MGLPSRTRNLSSEQPAARPRMTSIAWSRLVGTPPNPYSRNWSLGILADIQYVCASTAASRRTAMALPSDPPDEVDDVPSHHLGLFELQEVSGVFDNEGVAVRRENPLHPADVVGCHRAVIIAVEIKKRNLR